MTSSDPARPTSCCRPPPGTRSTTCPPPTCTRSCTRSPRRSTRRGRPAPTSTPSTRPRAGGSASWPRRTSGSAATWSPAPLQHDTPGETGAARRAGARLAPRGDVDAGPWPHHAGLRRSSSATTPPSPTRWPPLGPLVERLGLTTKAVTVRPRRRGRLAGRHSNGVMLGGAGRRPAGAGHRRQDGRGDPGPVRHHQRPARRRRASAGWRSAPAGALADLAEGSEEKRITLRRHPGRAGAGADQPGVVRQRDRRPALRAVHHQRRAAQAVAHADRPDAPLPRPRLDARARRGAADLPAAAGHARAVRRAARSAPDGGRR